MKKLSSNVVFIAFLLIVTSLMFAALTMMAVEHESRVHNKRQQQAVERSVEKYAQMVTYGVTNDKNPIQLAVCEKILDECVKIGVLSHEGKKVYENLKKKHSVAHYMELIDECFEEDAFESIQESDLWADYQTYVLEPRTDKD